MGWVQDPSDAACVGHVRGDDPPAVQRTLTCFEKSRNSKKGRCRTQAATAVCPRRELYRNTQNAKAQFCLDNGVVQRRAVSPAAPSRKHS